MFFFLCWLLYYFISSDLLKWHKVRKILFWGTRSLCTDIQNGQLYFILNCHEVKTLKNTHYSFFLSEGVELFIIMQSKHHLKSLFCSGSSWVDSGFWKRYICCADQTCDLWVTRIRPRLYTVDLYCMYVALIDSLTWI